MQQAKNKSKTFSRKSAFEWSLSYLDRWSISKKHLLYKLIDKGYEKTDIDTSIAKLEKLKLINDKEYAYQIIKSCLKKYKAKPFIEKKLLAKGISRETIYCSITKIPTNEYNNLLHKFVQKYINLLSKPAIYHKALLYGWTSEQIIDELNIFS
ncbi:MAG: RecX family transcriptional regulator [Bifidobacteriaceae bacterium]|nr:RecX family transcriptional regulator [Bifidobacteriaceae bacterium]